MLPCGPQNVGAYLPNTSCIAPHTSPREQRSFSAWRIAGRRFSLPRGRVAQLAQPPLRPVPVAVGLEGGRGARSCSRSDSGSTRSRSGTSIVVFLVRVHADDDVLADAVALLVAPRRLVDLAGDELDRVDRAAQRVDLRDQLVRARFDLVGQRLDQVGARERVDRVRRARLVGEDLLRAQRDFRRALRRQRQRLVEAVRVQRLRAAADGRKALQATRTMLFSGCCAVSVTPPVWVWKRSIVDLRVRARRSARA